MNKTEQFSAFDLALRELGMGLAIAGVIFSKMELRETKTFLKRRAAEAVTKPIRRLRRR